MISSGTVPKKCPNCSKNDEVIRVVYGEPTSETQAESDAGKVFIGGCCYNFENRDWYCKRCNINFYSSNFNS